MVEMRIERSVEADVLFQVVVRKGRILRGMRKKSLNVSGTAQAYICAVQASMSFCRCKESGHQVEQGGLSDPVFP